MRYAAFKATVFGLLGANTFFFLSARAGIEALDAVSWLTLLVLFELEVQWPAAAVASRVAVLARMARFAAAATIVLASLGYAYQRQWLDACNSSLWIAVVVLLEAEVRCTPLLALYRGWFKAAATLLYCGLGALVFLWLMREEWFDAYDAALWLVAFATIENDVLQARQRVVLNVP